MTTFTNKKVFLAERPVGAVKESNFRIETDTVSADSMKDGDVFAEVLLISVDPYMRGRMNEVAPLYTTSFDMSKPLEGEGALRVKISKNPNFKEGDIVVGWVSWQNYMMLSSGPYLNSFSKLPEGLSPENGINVIGNTARTGYFGLLEVGKPQPGDTVVISSAAGATGMVAGQIAKIMGCKVVGITSSDEKCQFIKELGFDHAINYTTCKNMSQTLKEITGGVDVYFDNVGGEISDAVIENINDCARIIICGQISMYNSDPKTLQGPRYGPMLLQKMAVMSGYLTARYADKFPIAQKRLAEWYKAGKLKDKVTFTEGIESVPQAFIGMMSGKNMGKMVVRVTK